jgi:uncharacterized membrane protein YbhN (UPF0104 family)
VNLQSNPSIPETRPPAELIGTPRRSFFHILRVVAVYSVLAVLLFFALRNAPLGELWKTLLQLRPWQISVLFGLNLFVSALIAPGWWRVVGSENLLGA